MSSVRARRYPAYKHSGSGWLGELPSHWTSRRLRFAADVLVSNVDKHTRDDELPVRLCNYTDVYYNDAVGPDLEYMKASATTAQVEKFALRAGDVLITKDSETAADIAVPAVVSVDMPDVVCGYHLALLRSKVGIVHGPYLAYAMRSRPIKDQFSIGSQGVTRYGLTYQKINDVELFVPPLDEQRAIARYLDRETARIRALIDGVEVKGASGQSLVAQLVRLVRERRDALITAAVTGQIDVRDEVAA